MFFTKRNFIRTSLLGVIGFLASRGRAFAHVPVPPTSPPLTPFATPLFIPPVLKPKKVKGVDTYQVSIYEQPVPFHPDLPATTIRGVNGIVPGPTIIANRGTPVSIEVTNSVAINYKPSIHLHGGIVPTESGGHPLDSIAFQGSRTFNYPNDQRGATLWYRASTYQRTGEHVHAGLAGTYIVSDKSTEAQLKLPKGAFDIPLFIQDRSFNPAGQIQYNSNLSSVRELGHAGDVLIVNGRAQPYFQVTGTLYRFRLINGSNAQFYNLKLVNQGTVEKFPIYKNFKDFVAAGTGKMPMHQIGTDAGLLQRTKTLDSFIFAPGERADILIDFSAVPVGSHVVLVNQYGIDLDVERTSMIMRFDVVKKGPKKAIPTVLAPWEEFPETGIPTRDFTLARHTFSGELRWTINGEQYKTTNPVLATVAAGSVERWRFVNPTSQDHPIHIHSALCQIVDINGVPQDPATHGWKDVCVIPPIGEMTVLVKFPPTPGRYPFNCQVLEHQDFAMMAEYQVTEA